MWQSQLFGSLPMLLEFVNQHRLAHHQFKIAIVPPRLWQRRSSPRYYLIYRVDSPEGQLVGVAAAEEAVLRGLEEEEDAAVDTAQQIIASAKHRDEDEPH